LANSR
jgi:hypothetical protein